MSEIHIVVEMEDQGGVEDTVRQAIEFYSAVEASIVPIMLSQSPFEMGTLPEDGNYRTCTRCELICSICQMSYEPSVMPKKCTNGHTFCGPCIDTWCAKHVDTKCFDKNITHEQTYIDVQVD